MRKRIRIGVKGSLWPVLWAGLALALPGSVAAQTLVTTIPLTTMVDDLLSLDPSTNLLYTGGGNPGALPVDIVNLYTSGVTQPGFDGQGIAVDRLNDNYWVPGVYSGSVQVFDSKNKLLDTVSLGDCPFQAAFDQKHKQMWVGAQCGGGNDPVWAIDSTTFAIKAGPIGLGGVFGGMTVDPPTGVAYVNENGCQRVDPVTYVATVAPFSPNCPRGPAADAVTGYLYVLSGTTLQIWNGKAKPETLLRSITLPYTPFVYMGVNDALSHVYIQESGTSTLDIRNSLTGTEIAHFTASGLAPGGIAVDSTRGRVYINSSVSGSQVLYVIDDISTVRHLGTRGY